MMEKSATGRFDIGLLMLAVLSLASAMPCFAQTGAYNYNITVTDPNSNYSVGQDMLIKAYVSYGGAAVKEYPCLLYFYGEDNKSTLYSKRIYTDELGALVYSEKAGDVFSVGRSYIYSIQCSNATVNATMSIFSGTRHTLIDNWVDWFGHNVEYVIICLIVIGVGGWYFFGSNPDFHK